MDLFEYQARDLFAEHGVPVLAGAVAETPEEARARRRAARGGRVVVKAQVKTGGRGKAGGVKLADDPADAEAKAGADPRHGHQGPHGPPGDARAGRRHRGGVLLLLPARPRQPHLPGHGLARGRHGHRGGRRRPSPRRWPGSRSTPSPASTTPRPARSPSAASFPAEVARPGRRGRIVKLWDVFVKRGRHAGRGQPAGQDRRRHASSRSTARSPSTRTPTSATPTTRRCDDKRRRRPARGRGQGEGPQLRQARRRGRHHRQRRRPGHEHPRRRRVRRRGVRRRQAGQLPRHRRRRLGRGDGQRPGDHPGRPGRARASSSTSSAASPPATRSPTASCRRIELLQARATTSTKPLVVRLDGNNAEEGRRILAEAEHAARRAGRHHGRRGAPGRRARGCEVEGTQTWRSSSTENSEGPRPGHHRLRGHQAHPAHGRVRAPTSSPA